MALYVVCLPSMRSAGVAAHLALPCPLLATTAVVAYVRQPRCSTPARWCASLILAFSDIVVHVRSVFLRGEERRRIAGKRLDADVAVNMLHDERRHRLQTWLIEFRHLVAQPHRSKQRGARLANARRGAASRDGDAPAAGRVPPQKLVLGGCRQPPASEEEPGGGGAQATFLPY